jgi:uncharacterized protein (TIGR02145 family)
MKINIFIKIYITAISLIIISCNPDEGDNPSGTSTGGGNNNGGGNSTLGSPHSCGAPNVHNPNLTYGSVTDQEGNTYKTIVIGTQEWMAENLKTSKYRNGDSIGISFDGDYTDGRCAIYDEELTNACPFGRLYNWYACDDPRGLCPVGWHIPSDAEWSVLANTLDPNAIDEYFGNNVGSALISATESEHYDSYYASSISNSSGFSALLGGVWDDISYYDAEGIQCSFWSSTQGFDEYKVYIRTIQSYGPYLYRSAWGQKGDMYTVRCLKD